jgi:hypothetical protein
MLCELNEAEKAIASGIKNDSILTRFIDDDGVTTYRIKTVVKDQINYLRVSFKNKDWAVVLNALVNEFNQRLLS